jgi:uncharacterized protein YneF (UPF0154 family)
MLVLLIIFLAAGALSMGCFIGLIIAEKNVARNIEKSKRPRKSQ